MIEPAAVDEALATAWRPAVIDRAGLWRLRSTWGLTRRANSVLAIGEPRDTVAHVVDLAEQFAAHWEIAPSFQVSSASTPPELARALATRGYTEHSATSVLVAPVGALPSGDPADAVSPIVTFTPQVNDAWFDVYWSEQSRRSDHDLRAAVRYRSTLLAPEARVGFGAAYLRGGPADGPVAGVGQVVGAGPGVAVVQCMVTRPDARRRGVARALLSSLGAWAVHNDCAHVALAVMDDNAAARRLYESVGFVRSHGYTYWTRGAGPDDAGAC